MLFLCVAGGQDTIEKYLLASVPVIAISFPMLNCQHATKFHFRKGKEKHMHTHKHLNLAQSRFALFFYLDACIMAAVDPGEECVFFTRNAWDTS